VLPQAVRVFFSNSSDAILNDSILADVGRHDAWHTNWNVVRSVQLASKWTSLNVASPALTNVTKRCELPMLGDLASDEVTCHNPVVRPLQGQWDVG
jgi:hypothetical protein